MGRPPGASTPFPPPISSSSVAGTSTSVADLLRAPFMAPSMPEDLSRPGSGKGFDYLQQSLYNNHKIQELHERALRSPSMDKSSPKPPELSPAAMRKSTPSPRQQPPMASPLGSIVAAASNSGSTLPLDSRGRSPPALRHVHTHTHTHYGLGLPMMANLAPPTAHSSLPAGFSSKFE